MRYTYDETRDRLTMEVFVGEAVRTKREKEFAFDVLRHYDAQGKLIKVDFDQARRRFPAKVEAILKAKERDETSSSRE